MKLSLFIKKHAHPKSHSSKTTFIRNHIHQKTFYPKPFFIKIPRTRRATKQDGTEPGPWQTTLPVMVFGRGKCVKCQPCCHSASSEDYTFGSRAPSRTSVLNWSARTLRDPTCALPPPTLNSRSPPDCQPRSLSPWLPQWANAGQSSARVCPRRPIRSMRHAGDRSPKQPNLIGSVAILCATCFCASFPV